MAIIDKIRVNGTDYGISTGGEMPVSVYFGYGNSGHPTFSNYNPSHDEEYLEISYSSIYIRRRAASCGEYDYDFVVLVDDDHIDHEEDWVPGNKY